MTNEQRLKALEMLLNGKSYEDVGNHFCVSKAVIWEMFHGALKDIKSTQSDESNCKYKRLIKCINEKYGNVPVAARRSALLIAPCLMQLREIPTLVNQ